MRLALKLVLLCMSAVVLGIAGAAPAAAQEAVEVVDEGTGTHCSDLSGDHTTGGCEIHAAGTMELRVDLGIFGESHEATCNLEVDGRIAENGDTAIDAVSLTPGDANCATVAPACDLPWEGTSSETAANTISIATALCLDPAEGPVCSGNLGIDLAESTGEHYEATFTNRSVGLCELDMDLALESTQQGNTPIHINHSVPDPVEVVSEETGTHCPVLSGNHSAGGCPVHAAGTMELRVDLGIFGESHEATCNLEVDGRIAENGDTAIDSVTLTAGDANCPTVSPACDLPWEGESHEEGDNTLQAVSALCLDPAEGPVCNGSFVLDLAEQTGEHYEAAFTNRSVGLCELDMSLAIESTQPGNTPIHVNHAPPEPLEVVDEGAGEHCSELSGDHTSGGCGIHTAGTMELRVDFGIFGEAHEATCNLELDGRIAENGDTAIDAFTLTAGDANCPTVSPACDLPWEGAGREDAGDDGTAQFTTALCIDPAEGPVCSGNLGIDLVEAAGEHYEAAFTNRSVGLCEIDMDLALESTQQGNTAIHINHTP